MKAFSPGGVMDALATDLVRLPGLYAVDEQHHMILMEDVFQCPDLETWLREPHANDESEFLGSLLGDFIGKLHRVSALIPGLSKEFNNQKFSEPVWTYCMEIFKIMRLVQIFLMQMFWQTAHWLLEDNFNSQEKH
jgi:hypothetical protein